MNYKSKFPDAANGRGDGNCNFVHPFGMTIDEADCGHIYVADSHNKRVQIYTKDWLHIRSIGYVGKITDADDDVGIVGGTAVDTNGKNGPTLYVTDVGGSDDHNGPRVQIFDECVDTKLSAWYRGTCAAMVRKFIPNTSTINDASARADASSMTS